MNPGTAGPQSASTDRTAAPQSRQAQRAGVGVLSSFSNRNFRFMWPSDGLTTWATEVETLVLGWYLLEATNSAFLVGLLGALRFGGTILGPIYGMLADRFDRRRLLIGIRLYLCALAVCFSVLALSGALVPIHAFIIALLAGLGRPFDNVVRQALLADVMPARSLANALALNRSVMDIGRIGGAALGGILLARLGVGEAYVAVTAFYLFSTLLALGIALEGRSLRASTAGWLSTMREGVAYMRRDEAIVAPMFLAFLVNMTLFPLVNGMMPVVAREVFDRGAEGLGTLQASSAIGALIGSILLAAFNRSARPARIMLVSIIVWHALLILFTVTGLWIAALVVLFVWGASQSTSMITMSTTLLRVSSPEFRGRVMGVRSMAVYGLPMGLLITGYIAEVWGIRAALLFNGWLGLALTVFAALKWRSMWSNVHGAG